MQWYVYLIAIAAAAFLAQVAVELFSRPLRDIVRLRRTALERILFSRTISPPRPRELAISSQAIREYDQAVRKVREAQRSFADLGAQLVALGEGEPTIRAVLALFGLDMVQAGRELIKLSEVYATATVDSDELSRAIKRALDATSTALASRRNHSGNDLIKIRLEPMCLRDAVSSLGQRRPPGRPRVVTRSPPRQAPSSHHLRGQNARADRRQQSVPVRQQAPAKSRAY